MNPKVEHQLKADRQWSRPLRISHYLFKRDFAKTEEERIFWNECYEAVKT